MTAALFLSAGAWLMPLAAPVHADVARQGQTELAGASAAPATPQAAARAFRLLGTEMPPGTTRRLAWYADPTAPDATPVLVAHGTAPGPVLCLTAAVHGDELNGIAMIRELFADLDADRLNGTVVGVPIVNLYGYRQGERYLPDRRDLNRFFPGDPRGSFAARTAHAFFNDVIMQCDYLVDLHTGSLERTNLPQLRADLNDPGVLHLTRGFGATAVLHGHGPGGTLRRAATAAGIPAVVVEAGAPNRYEPEQIAHGVKALRSLLNYLGARRDPRRARRQGHAGPAGQQGHPARHRHRPAHRRPPHDAFAPCRPGPRHGAGPDGAAGLCGVPHRHPPLPRPGARRSAGHGGKSHPLLRAGRRRPLASWRAQHPRRSPSFTR
jgi:predicted deacylase